MVVSASEIRVKYRPYSLMDEYLDDNQIAEEVSAQIIYHILRGEWKRGVSFVRFYNLWYSAHSRASPGVSP